MSFGIDLTYKMIVTEIESIPFSDPIFTKLFGEGTLCKYATAYVDTHRRNCDLAGTPDAEKKQNSDWVPGYCKNVHTVWKSVPAPVLGLPTRRPEDWFSTECYVPTVLRILFSREHYRTSTSRFSTVHYIPTVLGLAHRTRLSRPRWTDSSSWTSPWWGCTPQWTAPGKRQGLGGDCAVDRW